MDATVCFMTMKKGEKLLHIAGLLCRESPWLPSFQLVNSFPAEEGIFQENLISIMTADAPVPQGIRPSTAMILTIWDKHVLVFLEEWLQLPVPSQFWHDEVIKWKHFPCYWPSVQGIHWSPVNSPHKGQWHTALMFSLICAWINGWVNNHEAGDLIRRRTHDVTVMRSNRKHQHTALMWCHCNVETSLAVTLMSMTKIMM